MSWLCLVCTSGAVGRAVERLEGTLGRARDHLDGMDARRDRIARALKEANEAATTRLLEAINAGEAAPPPSAQKATSTRASLSQAEREHALTAGAVGKIEAELDSDDI